MKSEINKIERIASTDLENTMLDNQDEAEKQYGSATSIGIDIKKHYYDEAD